MMGFAMLYPILQIGGLPAALAGMRRIHEVKQRRVQWHAEFPVREGDVRGSDLAVDQALITQVLPAARDRAKDLGIINIAIVGPSTIGPAIAAPITAEIGYPALFGATAIVAVLASVLVWRIKSVA